MAAEGGGTTELRVVPGVRFPVRVPVDNVPATLAGTGAGAWTDRDERMWTIVKLFQETHTDFELYDTTRIGVGFDQGHNSWLHTSTGLRP